jgi:hypothetical protein
MTTLARGLHESTTAPVQFAAGAAFLQPLLRERGYPIVAAITAGGQYENADKRPESDIDFGLGRILDGIDVLIAGKQ